MGEKRGGRQVIVRLKATIYHGSLTAHIEEGQREETERIIEGVRERERK